jgi:hypothetical protein
MRDHQLVESGFTVVTKGRMPEIMSQRGKLNEIEVDTITEMACLWQVIQAGGNPARDLSDLERVRQPISEEVRLGAGEELGFALQATK